MNTIIEIIKNQNTFLESSLVVFWLFCVVSFYSTLVYGVGYIVYERVVKK